MRRRLPGWLVALALLCIGVDSRADGPATSAPSRPRTPAWMALSEFASGLERPGALLALPNGDLLVAEHGRSSGSGRIVLLRDADRDGSAERSVVLRADVERPAGMLLRRDRLYIAHADGIDRCAYLVGQLRALPSCRSLDLSGAAGPAHGLTMSPDEQRLYTLVDGRVVAFPPGGGEVQRVGIAPAVRAAGLAVEPQRARAWRADLGPEPGPDYVLEPAGSAAPAMAVPSTDAVPVALQFYRRRALPAELLGAALLALPPHTRGGAAVQGRIVAVPFRDGAPAGPAQELMAGRDAGFVPAGVAVLVDGSIVVADAARGRIWRLSYLP